jgi:peptide/nickel transport system substrate-binding protein
MFKKHNKKLLSMTSQQMSRRNFLRFSGLTFASASLPIAFGPTSQLWTNPTGRLNRRQEVDVLRVAWQVPVTLDPANLSSDSEVALVNQIYDYLIDTDDAAQLVPRLAQEWAPNEDGTAYTLSLVENATFHDGSPFTSADVMFTFDRLRDPDVSNAAGFFSNIESVEAPDDFTVVFNLSAPAPDFLYNLSDNRAVILKDGTTDPLDFNGTGPFRMVDFDAESRAVMERNPDYWLDGAPTVAQLEFVYFTGDTGSTAQANALRDGSIDVMLRMPTDLFEALSGDFRATDIATNGYNLIRLRTDRGVGTDPRVFRAFKLATNNQQLWQIVGAGLGAPGNDTPIGPLYEDFYAEDLEPLGPDLEEARRLLGEAGYGDGLDLTLHVPNSGNRPALGEAFRSSLQQIGVNIEIRLRDEGIYYSDVEDNWLSVDLGMTGWGSRATPQQYLDLQLRTGARWNEANYSNEQLDQLIELAGTSLDREERAEAYRDIQALLIEEGPIIVPFFFPAFVVTANDISGVRLYPFPGRTDFRFATSE